MEAGLEATLDALLTGAYIWHPGAKAPHEAPRTPGSSGGAGADALAALLALESHYYNLAFHQEGGGQTQYAELAGALEQAAAEPRVDRAAAAALQDAARASHARAVLVATYASLGASASHAAPAADLRALCGALDAAAARVAPAERPDGALAAFASRVRLEAASLRAILDAADHVASYRFLEAVVGLQNACGALEAWSAALSSRPPAGPKEKGGAPPVALLSLQWSAWGRVRSKAAAYFHRYVIAPREEALAAVSPLTAAAAAAASAVATTDPSPSRHLPAPAPAPVAPPAFGPLRTDPDLVSMLESVGAKLDAIFIALVLDSAEVPCYHEEGYRVCADCEAPTGLRSYPCIFLHPARTSTTEHWPTVVSLLLEQRRSKAGWGGTPFSYHEPKAQASYMLARVEPAVSLVAACRGQRRAAERAVQEALVPLLEALRLVDIFRRLARRPAGAPASGPAGPAGLNFSI
eukprot:tig00021105_g18273.t1